MASTEGFEPPTVRLEGACSIQLSYVDIMLYNNNKFKGIIQDKKEKILKMCTGILIEKKRGIWYTSKVDGERVYGK